MNRISSIAKSIFFLYLAWAIIVIARGIWIAITSDFREQISSEAFQSFFLMFVAMMLFFSAIGGVLAWFAQAGKIWAKWLFIMFCVFYSVDSLFGTSQLTEMYKQASPYSWFRGPVSVVIWSLFAVLALSTRPNKTPQPTPKSGAAEL